MNNYNEAIFSFYDDLKNYQNLDESKKIQANLKACELLPNAQIMLEIDTMRNCLIRAIEKSLNFAF